MVDIFATGEAVVNLGSTYITALVSRSMASGYRGRVGNIIRVQAEDNVKVTRVQVAIYDARERVIEEGEAISDSRRSNL